MMHRLSRHLRYVYEPCKCHSRQSLSTSRWGGDATDSTDKINNKTTKVTEEHTSSNENRKKEEAKSKLAGLLSSLAAVKDTPPAPRRPPIKLSLPKPRRLPREVQTKEEEQLVQEYKATEPKLAAAVRAVGKSAGGDVATQSELLQSLRQWRRGDAQADIKTVLEGLSVERRPPPTRLGVATLRRTREGTIKRPHSSIKAPRLFTGEALNIFPPLEDERTQQQETPAIVLPVWDAAVERELRLSVARPPASAFQEMALWTEQGKLWRFPIDNEIGLDEEKKVGFQEHIFMERHITDWCPRTGPVAHFMELVCVGLSKNPYVTVKRKIATLDWYRDFFMQRQQLLQEVGAMTGGPTQASKDTQPDAH